MNTRARLRWTLTVTAAVLAVIPSLAAAQTIYRIVSPDGRITFADRPPADSSKATPLGSDGRSADSGTGGPELSFELRQLISRYPVSVYTGDNCEPCNAGRNLLNSRGIPHTERTIKTSADVEELQRRFGAATVPVLTIGGQRIMGFAASDWTAYLDAAGYPPSSRLPAGYRNSPATPLAPLTVAPAPSAPPQDETAPAAPPSPPDSDIIF